MAERLEKRLFTLKEAAHYLGRGLDSTRELIYGGELPVVQRGERGKCWLDIKDLDSWIDNNKHLELEVNK